MSGKKKLKSVKFTPCSFAAALQQVDGGANQSLTPNFLRIRVLRIFAQECAIADA
jgi:hypothetical protein